MALVMTAEVDDEGRSHLESVVKAFFGSPNLAADLGRALSPLLRGHPLDLEEMETLFVDAGYDPKTLPGFDVAASFEAFAGGFAARVVAEPLLSEELRTHVLLDQLHVQEQILEAVTKDSGEAHYLRTLIGECDALDLSPIDETATQAHEAGSVRLSDVFTTLYLKDMVRFLSESIADAFARLPEAMEVFRSGDEDDEKSVPLTAVEATAAIPRLVVLGRPGGGKSTLVNHLVVELARRRTGEESNLPGWPTDERPLPVRILLRRFAGWLPNDAEPGAGLVWDYLRHQLGRTGCTDAYDEICTILKNDGGVIFFDGLDEVHEDDARKRSLICKVVEAFAKPLEKCRVVVTCREYAYNHGDAWRLGDDVFTVTTLAPFGITQVKAFTKIWYRVMAPTKGWDVERASREATHLAEAVKQWKHLRELAESPLLLTLMAQIHGRDGYLPRDRADLYERTVTLLLAHWERRIDRDLRVGKVTTEEDRLPRLNVRIDVVRAALEKVAFEAHERQERDRERSEAAADIPGNDLLLALGDKLDSLDRAWEVIAYVQQRAGLLLAVDGKTYRFPHRTFQEYLAARYLLQQGEYDTMLRDRVRRDLAWWREVFLLAAGASRETPRIVSDLVDQLVPTGPPEDGMNEASAEEVRLAAQALEETRFVERVSEADPSGQGRFQATHKKIQEWLLAGMRATESLKPRVRARCGASLASLGDPREEVMTVEAMEFCFVPAGPFWMGSDDHSDREKPLHLNEHLSSGYWISRYPVTTMQFRQYVEASGAEIRDRSAVRGQGNAPVSSIDWNEAREFCTWLTEIGWLPFGWKALLPSEAEWEKAARGGTNVPVDPLVRRLGRLDGNPAVPLTENPAPQRVYPWVGNFDANRCNSLESTIHHECSVGCFVGGRSVHGCEELSGSVLEWTRSPFRGDGGVICYL